MKPDPTRVHEAMESGDQHVFWALLVAIRVPPQLCYPSVLPEDAYLRLVDASLFATLARSH